MFNNPTVAFAEKGKYSTNGILVSVFDYSAPDFCASRALDLSFIFHKGHLVRASMIRPPKLSLEKWLPVHVQAPFQVSIEPAHSKVIVGQDHTKFGGSWPLVKDDSMITSIQ